MFICDSFLTLEIGEELANLNFLLKVVPTKCMIIGIDYFLTYRSKGNIGKIGKELRVKCTVVDSHSMQAYMHALPYCMSSI